MCLFMITTPFLSRTAYYTYTSCIFLTLCFVEIDPSSSVWTRTCEGRLVRTVPIRTAQPVESTTIISDNLDLEAFRKQLKEEIAADTRSLIRE